MIRPSFILTLHSILTAAAAPGADAVARFITDDRIPGWVESMTPDQVVMRSPVLEKPAPFFVKNLVDITLGGALPDLKSDHEAVATMTNGDVIHGRLDSVTPDAVVMDTPFAGRMQLRRINVKDLSVQPRVEAIYRGPAGMEGWKTSGKPPAWSYENAGFVSNALGSIGMEDILPDECSVSFDIAWKDEALALSLFVFSKDPSRTSSSSGYEFAFNRGSVMVRNCKTSDYIGDGQVRELLENEKVRIEVRASRKTGKLCLYINGKIQNVWQDLNLKKNVFGKGFHLASQGTRPLRISRVTVAAWNGEADQEPPAQAAAGRLGFRGLRFGIGGVQDPEFPEKPAEPKEDGRMELANGDSIQGEPDSIRDGVISIKSGLGDIKLPVARLRSINLKKDSPESAIRRKGDVRVWFPDGSSLVFDLKAVEGSLIKAESQNFGKADIKIDTVARIDFNIHDPKLEGKHLPSNW